MTLDEYVTAVLESDAQDWVTMTQPIFLESANVVTRFGSGEGVSSVEGALAHNQLMTLRSNLSISLLSA